MKNENDKNLTKLRKKANESCKFRGHTIRWEEKVVSLDSTYQDPMLAKMYQDGYCVNCGKEVHLETRPAPNSIDISGEAIALGCRN